MGRSEGPLLSVRELTVLFNVGRRCRFTAVSGVSFEVEKRETLGLVGESGCGKSSVARAIVQLIRPAGGSVVFMGMDLTRLSGRQLRPLRPHLQMIFQHSVAALNPRRCVGDAIQSPLAVMKTGTRSERVRRAKEMMEIVGLPASSYRRLPHELSGGQCQRVQIARALISRPILLVCDEPVSSLDVSIQAQLLNLLEDMRIAYGLTLLFISHDLTVVRNVADRVAVMYMGKLCEMGPADDLYRSPRHPYTRALISAAAPSISSRPADAPALWRRRPPVSLLPLSGCDFQSRCPLADRSCKERAPSMREVGAGHQAACHHAIGYL